jgi:hypothetical protein
MLSPQRLKPLICVLVGGAGPLRAGAIITTPQKPHRGPTGPPPPPRGRATQ